MSLQKLNDMNGRVCSCGKTHRFSARIVAGDGALGQLPQIVEEYHEKMLAVPVEDGKAYLEKNHIDGEWDDDVDLDGEEYEASDEFTKGGYLVKVPVSEPWRIWAYLPYGGWNACPKVTEHMAVPRWRSDDQKCRQLVHRC